MKKRVLLFSAEPGGAETLTPVIRILRDAGAYDVQVLAYGHGLKRFSANGIECIEIQKISRGDARIIEHFSPDMIITSAAGIPEFDMSEKYLWESARKSGVMTFAFLDQWQNYVMRFSGPGYGERLTYLPDLINCIDSYALNEMKAAGFPENVLSPLGQPYLSEVHNRDRAVNSTAAITKVPGLPFTHEKKSTVLFVSEAIREHFGEERGYDQFKALRLLLCNAAGIARECGIIVKLHPKDKFEAFRGLVAAFPGIDIRLVRDELSPSECLNLAETVFGMTSVMLIEAFMLGKRVVSLQPGLRSDDLLVTSRRNLMPVLKEVMQFDPFEFDNADPAGFDVSFDRQGFLKLLAQGHACPGPDDHCRSSGGNISDNVELCN